MSMPMSLKFLDVSDNRLSGELSSGVMWLPELTKLLLGKNQLSGKIPPEMSSCSKLQLLDLGDNSFVGEIPPELSQLFSLEISLNLSCNQLSGNLPRNLSGLSKLTSLDISHNYLSGDLIPLTALQNLVSLNISFNSFSGELPDTPFFRKIPVFDLTSNQGLYITGNGTMRERQRGAAATSALKLAMSLLLSVGSLLLLAAAYALFRALRDSSDGESGDGEWEVTLLQKMDLSIEEVVMEMTSANVIGTGSSAIVYRVGEMAVKKMWSAGEEEDGDAFRNEIAALGSIRHRNIVRLLGYATNRRTKLLFYHLPNGSLSSMLQREGKAVAAVWEERYYIALGVAEALAYLHHDCVPTIIHGDVKAMNVLLGDAFEPYLADFGLARLANSANGGGGDCAEWEVDKAAGPPQRIAGSYGYIAPEHASMLPITEKSDVYSYGVVLL
ncbi:hypothetical protein HPP92_018908 [Vanilla planifolia]|uniref:Protein kinase domain-containing protein n=1 Tax=Vanilla planifolia TaxID=51239 RepID=A0A835QEH1_VANPL|nr:hypothetical protein HPP92_018908 [Vanilla planifolia]